MIFQGTWSSPSSGLLITLESGCVNLPARNKAWRQYSCKLFQFTTLSSCNQAWRQGICDALCTHTRLRLTQQDLPSRSDPAITVEPRQPRAADCTNDETSNLLAWTMSYREQVLLGASLFLPLLSAMCRCHTCCRSYTTGVSGTPQEG